MSKIKNWKPVFLHYKKIIGVECENQESIGKLIKNMAGKNLITCPFEIIDYTLIVPQAAKPYLDLEDIKHKVVELRYTWHLSEDVLQEVAKRFRDNVRPNYYSTKITITRTFVELTVVREIEENIKQNKKR